MKINIDEFNINSVCERKKKKKHCDESGRPIMSSGYWPMMSFALHLIVTVSIWTLFLIWHIMEQNILIVISGYRKSILMSEFNAWGSNNIPPNFRVSPVTWRVWSLYFPSGGMIFTWNYSLIFLLTELSYTKATGAISHY